MSLLDLVGEIRRLDPPTVVAQDERALACSIEMGKCLLETRNFVDHKRWEKFIDETLDIRPTKAWQCIYLYQHRGDLKEHLANRNFGVRDALDYLRGKYWPEGLDPYDYAYYRGEEEGDGFALVNGRRVTFPEVRWFEATIDLRTLRIALASTDWYANSASVGRQARIQKNLIKVAVAINTFARQMGSDDDAWEIIYLLDEKTSAPRDFVARESRLGFGSANCKTASGLPTDGSRGLNNPGKAAIRFADWLPTREGRSSTDGLFKLLGALLDSR